MFNIGGRGGAANDFKVFDAKLNLLKINTSTSTIYSLYWVHLREASTIQYSGARFPAIICFTSCSEVQRQVLVQHRSFCIKLGQEKQENSWRSIDSYLVDVRLNVKSNDQVGSFPSRGSGAWRLCCHLALRNFKFDSHCVARKSRSKFDKYMPYVRSLSSTTQVRTIRQKMI